MQNKYLHIAVSGVLVVLLLLLLDPFMVLMPHSVLLVCLVLIAVLLLLFAGFVLLEHAKDEREEAHRTRSGRIAYLSGLIVLSIGLVTQGFSSHVDPWIIGAISVMILAKLFSRLYEDTHH